MTSSRAGVGGRLGRAREGWGGLGRVGKGSGGLGSLGRARDVVKRWPTSLASTGIQGLGTSGDGVTGSQAWRKGKMDEQGTLGQQNWPVAVCAASALERGSWLFLMLVSAQREQL